MAGIYVLLVDLSFVDVSLVDVGFVDLGLFHIRGLQDLTTPVAAFGALIFQMSVAVEDHA